MSIIDLLHQQADHIYVVHLERDSARKEVIDRIFKDLDFEYFKASDKLEMNYEQLIADGVFDEYNQQVSRSQKKLPLGHIACSLSHQRIYQDVLDKGYERVIIFEDDIVELPDAGNLAQALAELPKDWDVFMLGYMGERWYKPSKVIDQFFYKIFRSLNLFKWGLKSKHYIENRYTKAISAHIVKMGEFGGTHAYMLNQSGAAKLLKHQTPVRFTADGLLNHAALQVGDTKVYGIQPSLFTQGSMMTGTTHSHIAEDYES